MTPGDAPRDDLADLRAEFAGSGFRFGVVWASAASGPDARRLYPAVTACSSPPGPFPNCASSSATSWPAIRPPFRAG